MAPICGVCETQESKYKCPVCALRYCSIACYKPHRAEHDSQPPKKQAAPPAVAETSASRTSRKTNTADSRFSGFDNDPALSTLLHRYPLLRIQLQTIYALTLDPGPEEERDPNQGGQGGWPRAGAERMQRSRWTREKGDREASGALRRMTRMGGADGEDLTGEGRARGQEQGDGMREFLDLCRMKFGNENGDDGK